MGQTPLVDALRAFAARAPLRMHMPGHKGHPMPLAELGDYAALDVTELGPTGDLFSPGGPIEAAEALWAKAFGMESCLFLTGGSTQGLHAALALANRLGDAVLFDRDSHRAVFNAMALLDLRPTYLPRPWLSDAGVTGPISPQSVEESLKRCPEIKTVCITSPTYYGVLSDISAIAQVVHSRGGILVVDGAHGAHLPFVGENPYLGADLVVASAHKTLPAPGQTALLFSGGRFSMDDLRRVGSIYGSSSPSYPMMAALDAVRAYMEESGAARYRETAGWVAALRDRFPLLTGVSLDPTRFVFPCANGFQVQAALEAQGIYPEMADRGHVVLILTCFDSERDVAALAQGLAPFVGPAAQVPPPPPLPEQVCTPRQALFAPRRTVDGAQAEGLVAAVQVAPYPPGIPVVAPGERFGKKQLSYLREIEYNGMNKIGVL